MNEILKNIKIKAQNEKIIVGVSGGLDSMVLLDLLLKKGLKKQLIVAHVNYHQRQEASDLDERLVQETCLKEEIIFEKKDYLSQKNSSFEKDARDFRYNFFAELAKKYQAQVIFTAHHLNDQVENVLLKMVRGGELSQVYALKKDRKLADVIIKRPLIECGKKDLLNYAKRNNIAWREDVTNYDADYTSRNLVRNEIVPKLTKLNKQAEKHISEFADQISEEELLLADVLKNNLLLITNQQKKWTDYNDLWKKYLLKQLIKDTDINLAIKKEQLDQIVQLINNRQKANGEIALNKQYKISKSYDEITLLKRTNEKKSLGKLKPLVLELKQWHKYGFAHFSYNGEHLDFDFNLYITDDLQFEKLILKAVDKSDVVEQEKFRQKIRRLFINKKIPVSQRDTAVELLADDKVLAVFWENGHYLSKYVNQKKITNNWVQIKLPKTRG